MTRQFHRALGFLWSWLRGEPPPEGSGRIQRPRANETLPREPVHVRGWALPSSPLARVEITVDGKYHGSARLGRHRSKVGKRFRRRPDAIVSGFEYLFDVTSLPWERSVITLGAIAHGLDGSSYKLAPVTVRVAPREPTYEEHEGSKVALRARAGRLVSGGSTMGEERIRLLAFTHHMGYGGGQLYLYELLRRLSCENGFACTVVAPDDGPLRSATEALGIPVHVTGTYPYKDTDLFESKVQEITAWASPQGFNVALVNTVVAFPGPEVAMRLGIPFVWAIHESWAPHIVWSDAHPDVRQRLTHVLREAAVVVFEADATRLQYRPCGEPERFIAVPYGIDLDQLNRYRASFNRAAARRRLGIPEGAIAILCMGTIEPRKSQISLAQAFREMTKSHPNAFLILVGDTGSSYTEAVRSYVAAAGMQQRVLIVPVVSDPYEWYGSADLLVCPSDVESLPRSVLDAMAFELPVLATRVFGLSELIEDGKTGYLCPPRDLAALVAALDRVLSEDPEKRHWVAANGANLVRARHDSRGYAEAYLRLMRGLIQNPEAKPRDLLAGDSP